MIGRGVEGVIEFFSRQVSRASQGVELLQTSESAQQEMASDDDSQTDRSGDRGAIDK